MGFVLRLAVTDYSRKLEAQGLGGQCMGMSCAWAIDVIAGTKASIEEPLLEKGIKLQNDCRLKFAGRNSASEGCTAFFNSLVLYELKKEVARDHDPSVKLVNSLPTASGNAAIVASWSIQDELSCLGRFGPFFRNMGHAVGLMKLKQSQAVYLYDPNYGVFKWRQESGVSLKSDLKQYMLRTGVYGRRVKMEAAMKISTDNHIPANNHVIPY